MGQLLALAVHGDAFVHRRKNGTILIDGGGSSATLAAQLVAQKPPISRLDVVVCTHADLDHANGLKSVLKDWRTAAATPVAVGEFWLPGRWLEVARTGLQDPERLMSDLTRALDNGVLAITRALFWAEEDVDNNQAERSHNRQEGVPNLTLKQLVDALSHEGVRISVAGPSMDTLDRVDAIASADAIGFPTSVAEQGTGTGRGLSNDEPHQAAASSDDPLLRPSREDVQGVAAVLNGILQNRTASKEIGGDATIADPEPSAAEPFEPEWVRAMREKQRAPADRGTAAGAFWNARRRVIYRIGQHRHLIERGLPVTVGTSKSLGAYCLALIDAAEAIVEIARHAIEEGVPIRWFDYDAYTDDGLPRGGRSNFLLPMNAVELRSPPVVQLPSVVFYLSLSKANRESLVFYAPAEPGCRGVVFCGDSRLGYGWGGHQPFHAYREMSKAPQVGTAPHHAAESADLAYVHAPIFNIDRWVCAANGRTKPGPSFRAVTPNARCCTACPLLPKVLSTVSINLDLSGFTLPGRCDCT